MPSREPAPIPPAAPVSGGGGRAKAGWLVLGGCLAVALAHDGWARERPSALRACPQFGDGFWAIPGTSTCLRLEGYARSDVFAHEGHVEDARFDGDPFVIADGPTLEPRVSFEPAANIAFDARSATEFGILRTFLELGTDTDDDRSVERRGGRRENRSAVELTAAYLQLGGFTAGYTGSFFTFDHPVDYFGTHLADFGDDQILLGYTATLSKGLSASFAIESGEEADEDGLFDYVFFTRERDERDLTDERLQTPNGVANLRLERSWGSAQVAGAVGRTKTRLFSEERPFENRKEVIGWAAQGGVALNAPQFGEDDAIVFNMAYSRGLSFYTIATGNIVWTDFDALRKIDVFTTFSGLVHEWTPTLRSSVGVSYASVNFGLPDGRDRASGLTATGNLVWSPVPDLDIGAELIYARVDAQTSAADLLETTDRKRGAFGAILRIERSFGP